jgi:predicted Zn-dependent protease with MMP-like domain
MPLRRRGALARRNPHRRLPLEPPRHESFEVLVERALDELPAEFRRLLRNVAIVIEELPSPEQALAGGAGEDLWLYGLYEGVPAVEYGADMVAYPNKITLFRLPLETDFADPEALADEVRRTVVHELAHHAGISDARLHELGFD